MVGGVISRVTDNGLGCPVVSRGIVRHDDELSLTLVWRSIDTVSAVYRAVAGV